MLRAMNPNAMVFFTKGVQGAQLLVADESWDAAAPPVNVVDTLGAGDATALCSTA